MRKNKEVPLLLTEETPEEISRAVRKEHREVLKASMKNRCAECPKLNVIRDGFTGCPCANCKK